MLERLGVDHPHIAVEEAGAVELAEDSHDAAGAVDVFDVHVGDRGRDLAEDGHAARQPVDVVHGEIDLGLVRSREQMQNRIGRAAHRNVERHRVLERLETRDRARQHAGVVLFVVAAREIDDEMPGFDEEPPAVGMGRERRAVARQREAERFGQAVHRIGGEHARARAAGRTGRALHHRNVGVADLVVGGGDHRVDEVDFPDARANLDLARLHRPAGDEDGGDIEAQRRHQHARRDLVAVRDADERVGAMGVGHVFDAVGDYLARGQRIEHAVMAHRDAVVDRDGVELLGDAARRLDLARDELAEVLEMDVAGHELGEGIGDGDDRLTEVTVLHAGRAPEAAGAGHVAAMRGGAGTIGRHWRAPCGVSGARPARGKRLLSHFRTVASKGKAGAFPAPPPRRPRSSRAGVANKRSRPRTGGFQRLEAAYLRGRRPPCDGRGTRRSQGRRSREPSLPRWRLPGPR